MPYAYDVVRVASKSLIHRDSIETFVFQNILVHHKTLFNNRATQCTLKEMCHTQYFIFIISSSLPIPNNLS